MQMATGSQAPGRSREVTRGDNWGAGSNRLSVQSENSPSSSLSSRYEEEVGLRANAENEFVALKKVRRATGPGKLLLQAGKCSRNSRTLPGQPCEYSYTGDPTVVVTTASLRSSDLASSDLGLGLHESRGLKG